jgi:hypothetical protein
MTMNGELETCSTCGGSGLGGIRSLELFQRSRGNKSHLRARAALPDGSDLDMFYVQHDHLLVFEEKVANVGGNGLIKVPYSQFLAMTWLHEHGAAAFVVGWDHQTLCTVEQCSRVLLETTAWVAPLDALGGWKKDGWPLHGAAFLRTNADTVAAGVGEWFLRVAGCEDIAECDGCPTPEAWNWRDEFDIDRPRQSREERVAALRAMKVLLRGFVG